MTQEPRGPGERGLIGASAERANYFQGSEAQDPPPDGPFASPLVPEYLEAFRAQLLKKVDDPAD